MVRQQNTTFHKHRDLWTESTQGPTQEKLPVIKGVFGKLLESTWIFYGKDLKRTGEESQKYQEYNTKETRKKLRK